jgi:protein SCO1/2
MNQAMTLRKKDFISNLVMNKWFWLFFCLFFFLYPIIRTVNKELPPPLPVLYQLKSFKLVDENNQSFGSEDLSGKVYFAHFHFTACPTVCPEGYEKLQKIQKRIKGVRQTVQIVSFSVDPKTDTPSVLFKKARELNANPYTWKFLTAKSVEEIEHVVHKGFKLAYTDPASVDSPYDLAHSEQLFLVDHKGRVRGIYRMDEDGTNRLMIDTGLLINRIKHNIAI